MFHVSVLIVINLIVFIPLIYSYQPYNETAPDYAASVHHLKQLVLAEFAILPTIFQLYERELDRGVHADIGSYIHDVMSSNFTEFGTNRISLRSFIAQINMGNVNVDSLADETVKHPLKSYRIIRRFIRFIRKMVDNDEVAQNTELVQAINKTMDQMKFPKDSDLQVAMQNILRLRQIYRFSVKDLLQGKLGDLETGSGLTVTQLVEIAEHAMILKMYTHAVDFYYEAIQRCEKQLQQDFIDCSALNISRLNSSLESTIKEHDELLLGNGYDPDDLDIAPPDSSPFVFEALLKNITADSFINRRFLQIDKELESFLKNKDILMDEISLSISPFLFEKICRGEAFQMKIDESHAKAKKCLYLHGPHPYFSIGPLKGEVHNESPYLLQIYDVVNDKEILDLQREVQVEMRQSRTTSTENDVVDGEDFGKTSRFRTSANAWIEDDVNESYKYLNKRIALITGMNTTGYYSTEIVQIAAYTPGGHYTPHSDAMFEEVILKHLPESELERGDRIMTFMIYLSDVEKGGGTGFPTLRTLVQPVKGSAVLWYNLKSDGSINYEMVHGSCPVVYGKKWIANKWIRSNDQMFNRKCPKTREAWKIR